MENNKPKTQKQHYIPQFYLRQWIDDTGGFYPIKIESITPPNLIVFDKKSSPSRFCYENFFYAQHTGKEDDISQTLEKQFADIEGVFSKLLPELEEKILRYEHITDEEKYHLSEFMIFIWLKGKQYREQAQKMSEELVKNINRRIVHYSDRNPKTKAKMEELGVTKEQLIDFAERGEYTVDFGNMHHLAIMKEMYGFCNLLSAKHWKVYISRKGEFITTDVPYTDIATSQHFLGNDFLSREQKFILSPKVAILAIYPKNESSKKFVRKDITDNKNLLYIINSRSLINSIRFGFHKDKSLLEELKKYMGLEYQSRMQKVVI